MHFEWTTLSALKTQIIQCTKNVTHLDEDIKRASLTIMHIVSQIACFSEKQNGEYIGYRIAKKA